MTSRILIITLLSFLLLFTLGFGPAGSLLGRMIEEAQLAFLSGAILSCIGLSLNYFKERATLKWSAFLSTSTVGFLALYVYYAGIAVGNLPSGWVEGWALGFVYMLSSLLFLGLALSGLVCAIYCRFRSTQKSIKELVAIGLALISLSVIALPLFVMGSSFYFRTQPPSFLSATVWFGYIYVIAEWSREINYP